MAFRTMATVIDTDPGCRARIELAARMAHCHAAHLIAILADGGGRTPLRDLFAPAGAAARAAELGAAADAARGWLRALIPDTSELRPEAGDPVEAVLRHARHADLLVLPRGDEADSGNLPADLASRVLLHAGRPLLVLPAGCAIAPQPRHALVAWDGSRAATRALADALPLLAQAQRVDLLCVETSHEDLFSRLEINDLRQALQRQDVECGLLHVPADGALQDSPVARVVDAILDTARRSGCDLLVMGAYGHSPALERVLGGVTQRVLARSPVAMLTSH